MAFNLVAKPALNKAGKAKVTFKGHDVVASVIDENTGEQLKREYVKLQFEIMDTTKKQPIRANVIGNALAGRFLLTLNALGYELPTPKTFTDEDGFDVEMSGEFDEDGFETEEINSDENEALVIKALERAVGKVFTAEVEKNRRGYWEIKPETLEIMKKS